MEQVTYEIKKRSVPLLKKELVPMYVHLVIVVELNWCNNP
ncbi:hypothetical protein J804_0897 [Acinetobacter sp. 25977_1]|nr:hypothetical protein J804_0897 [Acinetobacter sp. 25977_1]EXT74173.1 hypothetical protein J813_0752 [Acinetobacter sp. 25977_10]